MEKKRLVWKIIFKKIKILNLIIYIKLFFKNRKKDDKKKGNKKKNISIFKVNKNNYGYFFFNNKYKYKRKLYVIVLYIVIFIFLVILIIIKLIDSMNKGNYFCNIVFDIYKNDI